MSRVLGADSRPGTPQGRLRSEKTKTRTALLRTDAQRYAEKAQALIRAQGDYSHITVSFLGRSFFVASQESDGPRPIARLTYLGNAQFGLSFLTHQARWEAMPASGTLESVIPEMLNLLGPYFQRMDFPLRKSGTSH